MNELNLLENELVPVYTTNTGEKVVYGTELHEVLGVKTPYKDWSTRRFNECDAIESEDFEAAQICASMGKPRKNILLSWIQQKKWRC